MHEHDAADPHAELGRVREVDGGLPAWQVLLLEEHLLRRPVKGPPVPQAALQRPSLARNEPPWVALLQELEKRRPSKNSLFVGLEQRNDLGVPDLGERIGSRPPVPRGLRLRRQRALLPRPS